MTEPTRLCGRYIHMAAAAISAIRTTSLNKAGIAFTQWQVLDKAPGNNRDELIHRLVELTVDDEAGIAQAIDELSEQGLLSTDDQGKLELTTRGTVLFQQVNAIRTALHNQLYDGIAAEDLATTTRVLNRITELARVAHAAQ
ncbi:MAG: hypothetical protein ACRDQU_22850 [Pseudonocardiaceae bacterium]